MKFGAVAARVGGALRECGREYRAAAAEPLALWLVIAVLNFSAQIIFHRELLPGEFGMLNTVLGLVGLLVVPVVALRHSFRSYIARVHPPERETQIRALGAASVPATETFAWAWAVIAFLLILLLSPLLGLPRLSLEVCALLTTAALLGAVVSGAVCEMSGLGGFWGKLLAAAALARVLLGFWFTSQEAWAESALAAVLVGSFLALAPALRQKPIEPRLRWRACVVTLDRGFLTWFGATLSVFMALYLFSSADRIVAQHWFGTATDNNIGLVDWSTFDAYQTAGLLGRIVIWGTQPLLWILFAQRSILARTTPASLAFYWAHIAALLCGAALIVLLAPPLSRLFCGASWEMTAHFAPSLAVALVPSGLLQGYGVFALASRRLPECFVLGACSLGYTLLLFLAGRQPQLMASYMFGAGLVSMMIVLFVGVVRWGRKQP